MLETYRTLVRHFRAIDVLGQGTTHQNRDQGIALQICWPSQSWISVNRRKDGEYWSVTIHKDGSIDATDRTPDTFVDQIRAIA